MKTPFELFISSTSIRYCYYKDTHKILGNTFGMLILQDFEALTPNLLARTIETIEQENLLEHGLAMGELFQERLERLRHSPCCVFCGRVAALLLLNRLEHFLAAAP